MRKQSLARKAVRTTIISSFVLALVALFIGLSVFGSGLIEQYAYRAYEIAAHACTPVVKMADSVGLADRIMETYRSLTPEERTVLSNAVL